MRLSVWGFFVTWCGDPVGSSSVYERTPWADELLKAFFQGRVCMKLGTIPSLI